MPLTPFHWSVVLVGLVFFDVFYIPALAISSVIMDVEPAYYLFISPSIDGTLHGFFHTYFGASLIALAVGFVLVRFRSKMDLIMRFFRIEQNISSVKIYLSSFLAAYSHIFLDSFMHADMKPFWPFVGNPFLGLVDVSMIYLISGLAFIPIIVLYIWRLLTKN